MPSTVKQELKKRYQDILTKYPDFILTNYKGLDVNTLSSIRNQLKVKGVVYQVIKNRVFYQALSENSQLPINDLKPHLKNTIAIAFIDKDFPSVANILKKTSEEHDLFEVNVGLMDATFYDHNQVKELASISTKEESLAKVAQLLQAPATQIASTMNQIISSIARGIQAIAEKNKQ